MNSEEETNRLKRCILKNLICLISVAFLALLCVCKVKTIQDIVVSSTFQWVAICSMLLTVVLLVFNFKKILPILYLSTLMLIVSYVPQYHPYVVLQSMLYTALLFSILITIGSSLKTSLNWGKYLIYGLIGIFAIVLINLVFPLPSRSYQIWIAPIACILFSFFVVYDINYFTRTCRGERCCEQGTVNLWLDFVNLFNNVLAMR